MYRQLRDKLHITYNITQPGKLLFQKKASFGKEFFWTEKVSGDIAKGPSSFSYKLFFWCKYAHTHTLLLFDMKVLLVGHWEQKGLNYMGYTCISFIGFYYCSFVVMGCPWLFLSEDFLEDRLQRDKSPIWSLLHPKLLAIQVLQEKIPCCFHHNKFLLKSQLLSLLLLILSLLQTSRAKQADKHRPDSLGSSLH